MTFSVGLFHESHESHESHDSHENLENALFIENETKSIAYLCL
jgi:hypothetical protein